MIPEGFSWVKSRAACSLEQILLLLGEISERDVKDVNDLQRPRVKFKCTQMADKIIVIRDRDMGALNEIVSVVIEIESGAIVAREAVRPLGPKPAFLKATPVLNERGECMLEVDGQQLRLWQFNRKALEQLFFGF